MKRLAALAAVLTLCVAASSGASSERVLGIDPTVLGMRLAWYDAATLTRLPGRTVPLANHGVAWSFSQNGNRLVVTGGDDLRFIDAARMRVLGHMTLKKVPPLAVKWLSSTRLLAVGEHAVAVVDPTRLRVMRRSSLPGVVEGVAALPNGLALLIGQDTNGFSPASVATVDAQGRVRSQTLDRITIGFRHDGDTYELRQAGFAIDAASRCAFVVGGDYTIATVDLDSREVSYHGGSTRSLAKELPGPVRWARWLGNGLLAVAGADGLQSDGLRIIDTRDWSTRVLDRTSTSLAAGEGVIVGGNWPEYNVYALDGSLRYGFHVESAEQVQIAGRYGYVCHGVALERVIDLPSGATVSAAPRACATVLAP